ncbi:hypothetical protein PQ462_14320 [Flavobacterium sp. KACC 22758]|jgi:hypothetical protein|uniref:hypothetical protein n=1 Tax=Flavobacterium sp. KACC 22758 TaxID=3025667 RepID=UPI0023658263|nr:hypothetical protein [Flavobacterium sp. KACC 22758]WDF57894.1 hypothetical protein PQ462_14320 [Flavobacterium sp. KACC 22758]
MAYSIKKDEVIKYKPEELKTFKLYVYEWIDNLNFTFDPNHFLPNADEYKKIAANLFKNAGWEGDGDIELIWIPPFVYSEYGFKEIALGFIVWHVKQEEDGISWLLSPQKLPFLEI